MASAILFPTRTALSSSVIQALQTPSLTTYILTPSTFQLKHQPPTLFMTLTQRIAIGVRQPVKMLRGRVNAAFLVLLRNFCFLDDTFFVFPTLPWLSAIYFPCTKACKFPFDFTVSFLIGSSGKKTSLTEKMVNQLHYSGLSKREAAAAWKTPFFIFGRFSFLLCQSRFWFFPGRFAFSLRQQFASSFPFLRRFVSHAAPAERKKINHRNHHRRGRSYWRLWTWKSVFPIMVEKTKLVCSLLWPLLLL